MKYLFLLLLPLQTLAIADDVFYKKQKLIKIAIIDTGIQTTKELNICPEGLVDLTGTGIKDTYGHGQNVAHIIASHLKNINYCMYIIKYTEGHWTTREFSYKALSYAKRVKADVVNFSAGGTGESKIEQEIINEMEYNGTIVIAAVGNENKNLDEKCNYFPACYKNINVVSVGSLDKDGNKSRFSNYGKVVKAWYIGENQNYGGVTMTGTSQATAHITGLLVRELGK